MNSVFQIADRLVDDICAMSPVSSTMLGLPGSDDRWGSDFGLAALDDRRAIRAEYEPQLTPHLDAADPKDRLAARVILGSFAESQDADEAGDHFRELRHMASPFHLVRSVFDMMPTDSAEARDNIVSRLADINTPLMDYRQMLQAGIVTGITVARRQVESVIAQARRMSAEPASLGVIIDKLRSHGLGGDTLDAAASSARQRIGEFGEWLESDYLPNAVEADAVGREVYLRAADRMAGMEIDPEEAYAWGWEEFARLHAEMERVAELIKPGVGFEAVKHYLETDPEVTASGTDELVAFVEERLGRAVDDLAGSHFDVPELIKPLTVSIAPPGTPLGAYYMRPSEDFSRPGGVWYSIGSQEVFPLYQHVSTAYHEGFPGHHLQIATAMIRTSQISRFQRLMTWYPGYGEGWGMYAEVLMGELGYLSNTQHYFGMLAKQMYRTARVVVDIGTHLEKTIDGTSPLSPGEPWTFDNAVEFMRVYGFRTQDQARDEVLRYMGWPGQAIAYKLGEREILAIRAETKARLGDDFDLRAFHSTVLDNGAMRLDLLREVVAEHLPG